MYCYDVLNDYILEILAAMLDEAIADLQRHPTHWTKLEACIYSFQSVAEHFEGIGSRTWVNWQLAIGKQVKITKYCYNDPNILSY